MSLRKETPCDYCDCPYQVSNACGCEYWCGAEEEEDYPTEEDLAEYNSDPYKVTDELISAIKEKPCPKCQGTEFTPVLNNGKFATIDSTCVTCGYVRYSLTD